MTGVPSCKAAPWQLGPAFRPCRPGIFEKISQDRSGEQQNSRLSISSTLHESICVHLLAASPVEISLNFMNILKLSQVTVGFFCLLVMNGCVTAPSGTGVSSPNQFTHGNVTLNLKKGVTTQVEVLRLFGAPNIATVDDSGQEVWSYQKYASVAKSSTSEGFFTIVLAGGGRTSSQAESTNRTMTLIIKFGSDKVVSEFSSFTSNF